MREIKVDIDVFSEIWTRRIHGETTENDVLRRLLLGDTRVAALQSTPKVPQLSGELELNSSDAARAGEAADQGVTLGKIRWVDDVQLALKSLGGTASLLRIYNTVRTRRRAGGRSIPRTFEAIIRRTLEDHSSDSANFKSEDLFKLVGRGEWGLR